MIPSQSRLFARIISKNREVYLLKIITLSIAMACSTLIILFSLNEFGYDRFHQDASSVFRILQRNNRESFSGNRLSNRIPPETFAILKSKGENAVITSRMKVMDEIRVIAEKQTFSDRKVHAADAEITRIFTFDIINGALNNFSENKNTILLSAAAAHEYFGTIKATGKKINLFSIGDTVQFAVAAVYKDFPRNSHEEFNVLIRYNTAALQSLRFNPNDAGVYGRALEGTPASHEATLSRLTNSGDLIYRFQSLPNIYFGPRVSGEDARHGDEYSILILVCINGLILFLALTTYVNLTTLTLPHRSKELAVRKLAGASQIKLIATFAKESFAIVGLSLLVGISILLATSGWIEPILSINLTSLILNGDVVMILTLMGILVILGVAPLAMTYKFAVATPTRLLSTKTITFPRFKRVITFFQLGISIFLIVASMVIKRQVNYSLLKEPGRNHDQIVSMRYPKGLTNQGFRDLRLTWKRNPNIVDVMATSQLPDKISSKDLNSEFYHVSVDPSYAGFFDLKMVEGRWFGINGDDSMTVVNEKGKEMIGDTKNVIGVLKDMSGQFNQPEKPVRMNTAPYYDYNYLCVRILEVDIRKTVNSLSEYSGPGNPVTYMNKRFEEWIRYQDRLNTLSELLAIISGILSCCAIYGLSVSLVRDKIKQIAIHKLCGATIVNITVILVREFAGQMLLAILIFGPFTFIFMRELLRNFVYSTHFSWLDPVLPLAYCAVVITVLCGFQALSLNKTDLSRSLKN